LIRAKKKRPRWGGADERAASLQQENDAYYPSKKVVP